MGDETQLFDNSVPMGIQPPRLPSEGLFSSRTEGKATLLGKEALDHVSSMLSKDGQRMGLMLVPHVGGGFGIYQFSEDVIRQSLKFASLMKDTCDDIDLTKSSISYNLERD